MDMRLASSPGCWRRSAGTTLIDMVDDRTLIEIPRTDYQMVPPDSKPTIGLGRSLARLALGGVVAGQNRLIRRLRQAQTPPADEGEEIEFEDASIGALVGYASLGAILGAADAAQRGVSSAAQLTASSAALGWRIVKPVAMSRPLEPVRRRAAVMAKQGEKTLDQWARTGYVEQEQGQSLAESITANVIDTVVTYLADNEAVAALIQAQAGQYLGYLNEHPEIVEGLVQKQVGEYLAYLHENPDIIANLIREQGDRYIDYLNKHPEAVQSLVQGQSLSMATGMVEEVREHGATADSSLEFLVRGLLHRPQREELPEPPPELVERAVKGRVAFQLPKRRRREW